jgi:hypothetical protein
MELSAHLNFLRKVLFRHFVERAGASLRTVAEQCSDFLMTPRILRLLEKYGFDVPPQPLRRTTGLVPSMNMCQENSRLAIRSGSLTCSWTVADTAALNSSR